MNSTYSQLPGPLNLSLRRGDEFGTTIDFDIDMSGYTVSSSLVSLITGSSVGTITSTISNAADGVVSVGMTEAQTEMLQPGTYTWRLEWIAPGSVKRTALTGFVEVTR